MPHPERIGPYRILERIGSGGMAEIFLAKHVGPWSFERRLVLKCMHPRFSQKSEFTRMFIHEAKLAALLHHYNIVQVHDLGEADGRVFMAMEYVPSQDLAFVLSELYRDRKTMPLPLILYVAAEILAGLGYAHRRAADDGTPLGIVHRDVSPQNVLLSYEGGVKLTDFGLAKVISQKDDHDPKRLQGKLGYVSPEQVLGHQGDQRSDLFSVGIVMWEMLSGRRLFRSENPKDTLEQLLRKPIRPPSEFRSDVTPTVDRILMKALRRQPDARYQTAGAFLGDVSQALDQLPRRAAARDLAVFMRTRIHQSTSPNTQGTAPRRPPSVPGPEGPPRLGTPRRLLGQILLEQGALLIEDLELGLSRQRARGGRIGEILLQDGVIHPEALAKALATQAELPFLTPKNLIAQTPSAQARQRFPREAVEAACIIPMGSRKTGEPIGFAVVDPWDRRAVTEAAVALGISARCVGVISQASLETVTDEWYKAPLERTEDIMPERRVRPRHPFDVMLNIFGTPTPTSPIS